MTYDVWDMSLWLLVTDQWTFHQSVISFKWVTAHGAGAGGEIGPWYQCVGAGTDTTPHICHNTWNIFTIFGPTLCRESKEYHLWLVQLLETYEARWYLVFVKSACYKYTDGTDGDQVTTEIILVEQSERCFLSPVAPVAPATTFIKTKTSEKTLPW